MMLELFAQAQTLTYTVLQYVFAILMGGTAVFLMLLVLVQRGRGGGLAGALGGPGGQSAFGTKAGDLFTKITMFTATFWILLCMAALLVLNPVTRETGEDGDEQPGIGSSERPGEDADGGEATEEDAEEAAEEGTEETTEEGAEETTEEGTDEPAEGEAPKTTEDKSSGATGEDETPPASDTDPATDSDNNPAEE